MTIILGILIFIVNLASVLSLVVGLPGTWVMVLLLALTEWLHPEMFTWTTIGIAIGLATLGEVLEFIAGAAGSKSAGGTNASVVGAILGGIVGGIAGTVLIPVPVLGSLLGSLLGTGVGALAGDLQAGRTFEEAYQASEGATWGRLWGTLAKVACGCLMLIPITLDSFL